MSNDMQKMLQKAAAAEQQEQGSKMVRNEAQREDVQAARSRDGSFGGLRLKLNAAVNAPGMHLYWVNDDNDGQLEELLLFGFTFVTKDQLRTNAVARSQIVADDSVDTRISRIVGKHENGAAQRAYLLQCTEEVWQENERVKQAQADRWDDQIRNKRTGLAPGEQYQPRGYTDDLHQSLAVPVRT